jgi:argininosuccinate synthase
MQASDLKGKTIAFAASGGLDSCAITRWLTEQGVHVIALTADLGQPDETDLNEITVRMKASGAVESVIVDAKTSLIEAGIKLIQAQAYYEGKYWNTTSIARHVTVQALLPELKKRNLSILSHGCTGRGNDQVRFQLVTNMLEPSYQMYAPWRDQQFLSRFRGRKEMIEYCASHHIPIRVSLDKPYSTDANMLGLTHEAGKLESLSTPWNFVTPGIGSYPKDAPDQSEKVTITFLEGRPTAINSTSGSIVELFDAANRVAGKHGVGIGFHVVENRFVGIKCRPVYETPGMELLGQAYDLILQTVLDRRGREVFSYLSQQIGKQIYQGFGFDVATQMLFSALTPMLKLVTGIIEVELYKGGVFFSKLSSAPHMLYSEETSSMEAIGDYDHAHSEGFLRVLGVSARALAKAQQVDKNILF